MIVASPRHPLATQARASLAALRSALWLLRESGSGTREATDRALLPHLRSYRRSIEIGQLEAIKQAAAEGLGLACLSRWATQDFVKARRLKTLSTSIPRTVRQFHWIVHRAKHMTPALLDFIESELAV